MEGANINNGAFYRSGSSLRVIKNFEYEEDLPFFLLNNALISRDNNGVYLITEIKERRVNLKEIIVVMQGVVQNDPLNSSENNETLYSVREDVSTFKPMKGLEETKPNFDDFERTLVERHSFIKTDFKFFQKQVQKQGYLKRFNDVKKGRE